MIIIVLIILVTILLIYHICYNKPKKPTIIRYEVDMTWVPPKKKQSEEYTEEDFRKTCYDFEPYKYERNFVESQLNDLEVDSAEHIRHLNILYERMLLKHGQEYANEIVNYVKKNNLNPSLFIIALRNRENIDVEQ
jgi:hypothetical protein